MSVNFVEALSRNAAQSVTRRGSLLTLAGALAATVVAPSLAQAEENKGQNNGQKRKKSQKKAEQKAAEQAEQARQQAEQARQQAENQANQICANQVAGCRAEILSNCEGGGECFLAANCCASLATCNTTEFFTCLVTAFSD